jgi:hypothetical protein
MPESPGPDTNNEGPSENNNREQVAASEGSSTEISASPDNPKTKRIARLRSWAISHKRLSIPAGLIIVALIGFGLVSFYSYVHKPVKAEQPFKQVTKAKSNASASPAIVNASEKSYQKISLGIQPLDAAEKVGDLQFFSEKGLGDLFGRVCTGMPPNTPEAQCPNFVESSAINYYRIGTTAKNQPLFAGILTGMMQPVDVIAVRDTPTHYTMYAAYAGFNNGSDSMSKEQAATLKTAVSNNVKVDITDVFDDFAFPKTASINGMTVEQPEWHDDASGVSVMAAPTDIRGSNFGPVAASAITKVGSDGNKTFYEVVVSDKPNYQLHEIYATFGGVVSTAYQLKDDTTAGQAPNITWTNGTETTNSHTYIAKTAGCGSAYGFILAKNVNPASLITAGKTGDGRTVYQLPIKDPLFTEVFKDDYADGTYVTDTSLKRMSADAFQAAHAVILIKRGNDYAVYLRDDLISPGGCGKPVIYLYPQKTTKVNVSVGAHITKSNIFRGSSVVERVAVNH